MFCAERLPPNGGKPRLLYFGLLQEAQISQPFLFGFVIPAELLGGNLKKRIDTLSTE
jgi:hypothetical protein